MTARKWLLAMGSGLMTLLLLQATPALAQEEYEYQPDEGVHEEEWYDPSDWGSDYDGMDYEDPAWWNQDYNAYYDDYDYNDDYYYDYEGVGEDDWWDFENDYETYDDYGYDYYTDDWYDSDFDDWYLD